MAGWGALAAVCGGADGGAVAQSGEEERREAAGLVGELWPPSAEELMGAQSGKRRGARQRGWLGSSGRRLRRS
jgi:hypothetical protein